MSKKRISGLIGIVVGGIWLLLNFRHFESQGFVAIGLPLILLVLGIVYFVRGKNEEDE
jgi:membrane-bound ClpP family serine protease